jgi:hypothetical protein
VLMMNGPCTCTTVKGLPWEMCLRARNKENKKAWKTKGRCVIHWTVEEVAQWVASISEALRKDADQFREKKVDGGLLCALDDASLCELGIGSVLERTRLMHMIKQRMQMEQPQHDHPLRRTDNPYKKETDPLRLTITGLGLVGTGLFDEWQTDAQTSFVCALCQRRIRFDKYHSVYGYHCARCCYTECETCWAAH